MPIGNCFLLLNGISCNYPTADAKWYPWHNAPDVPSCKSAFKEVLMQFWNSVEIVWRALDECVGVKWCTLHDSLTPRLPGQLSGSFFAIPLRFSCLCATVSQVLHFTRIQLLPNKRALTGLLIELLQLHTSRSIWSHTLVNIGCKYVSGGIGWVWCKVRN